MFAIIVLILCNIQAARTRASFIPTADWPLIVVYLFVKSRGHVSSVVVYLFVKIRGHVSSVVVYLFLKSTGRVPGVLIFLHVGDLSLVL